MRRLYFLEQNKKQSSQDKLKTRIRQALLTFVMTEPANNEIKKARIIRVRNYTL